MPWQEIRVEEQRLLMVQDHQEGMSISELAEIYSISRKSYGDGKQWQKIAAANPGLRPENLKVGQTIQIP
jgi:transposase